MSRVIFCLTDRQAEVLALVARSREIGLYDGPTARTLVKRGLLREGRAYREYALTPTRESTRTR